MTARGDLEVAGLSTFEQKGSYQVDPTSLDPHATFKRPRRQHVS